MRPGQRVTISVDAYRARLQRPRRQHRRRQRRALQPAAAGKRHRQLRESRAARAGEDRARSGREQGPPAAPGNVRGAEGVGAMSEAASGASGRARATAAPAVNPWIIALTVTLATFMEVLDTSIANVSLPHIAGGLSAGVDESTWILTSYLVSNAIVLPMSGWFSIADRAQALLHGVRGAVYDQFLPVRAGAESGHADLLPHSAGRRAAAACSRASNRFWPTRFLRRNAAWPSPMYGMAVVRGAGDRADARRLDHRQLQLALDFLHQHSGRDYLAAADLAADHRSAAPAADEKRTGWSIDYIGLGLLALGLGALQIVLDKGQRDDWFESHFIVDPDDDRGDRLVAVVFWEWRQDHPIIDLKLFRDRSSPSRNAHDVHAGLRAAGHDAADPAVRADHAGLSRASRPVWR